MRQFAETYAGKSATMDDFRTIAEKYYGDQLTWFFSQWLDSTGAPEFQVEIYGVPPGQQQRVSSHRRNRPGSRPVSQHASRHTSALTPTAKPKTRSSKWWARTPPLPLKLSDVRATSPSIPNITVLTNSSDVKLRASILRGMALQQQGDLVGCARRVQQSPRPEQEQFLSPHYRIAEVFFDQRNYQSSANSYRASINGDGEPRWTEVWSHIQLGKIFDITGQRERIINEIPPGHPDQRRYLRRSRRSAKVSGQSV